MEGVEEDTAELWWSWQSRFCGGERARRRRGLLGNGGAAELCCARGGGEGNEIWTRELVEQAGGGVQAMAGSARTAAACGLRGQAAGDGWRHVAVVF